MKTSQLLEKIDALLDPPILEALQRSHPALKAARAIGLRRDQGIRKTWGNFHEWHGWTGPKKARRILKSHGFKHHHKVYAAPKRQHPIHRFHHPDGHSAYVHHDSENTRRAYVVIRAK